MFKKQLAIVAIIATMTLAQERAPVFIATEELNQMIQMRGDSDLKIFDCTVNDQPDALLSYHQSHVPGAGFIDLRYFRNMTSKYSYMLPGVQ